jgi:serine/threonine protein kinase
MVRTLEKYEILEEIGHGGMATVYRARDTKLDRLVALKVMHPHLRGSAEARARFRREAQGVARLRHPRVLEIYDYSGEDSEESYIATELLTGPTLKKLADDHPAIPAEIAACIGIEVCRALGAAHAKGIVHRDVKPENILVHLSAESGARCVKLTDFGIADMVDSQTMTATGQILGSPGHMAPEQIEGRDTDPRTDVFSLGTVLYFLACGRLPFTGRNPHQVLKRIVDGEYADPLRVQPAIGGRMRAIIVRALSHDPKDRHASAAELEQELRAFVALIGIEDPEELLARYLADPIPTTESIVRSVIGAYTALGRRARDAGDVPTALDDFGRVLALDNGNAEVLALVESVGRSKRRRSQLAIASAAIGIAGLTGIAWSALAGHAPDPPIIEPGATATATAPPRDAAIAVRDGGSRATAAAPTAADAGVAVVAVASDTRPGAARPTKVEVAALRRSDIPPIAPTGDPVFVRFVVDPGNAEVSVDNGPFADLGPSFPGLSLRPGRHHFVVRANGPCCVPETFDETIPAGVAEHTIRRRLPSADAALIVRSAVSGTVTVDGRTHPTNEAIVVPFGAASERAQTLEFTVTAPGHAPYSGSVRLSAGQTLEHRVTLEPALAAP